MRRILIGLIVLAMMIPINAVDSGKIIVLMYHDFRNDILRENDNLAYVTTDVKFRNDINTLLMMGYQSMNLEMLFNGEYDARQNYFIITVDDGYISNYEILYPILRDINVYADIFICTDIIDENHFTFNQAEEMKSSGLVNIYSHFTEHIDVLSIGINEFANLAEQSYSADELSGNDLRIFSYPYGSYSRDTAEVLFDKGTALQLVQNRINTDGKWNPADYGILYRVNVEYGADVKALTDYYITQYCDR